MAPTEGLSCGVCMEPFTSEPVPEDRRPKVLCSNGHSYCSKCTSQISNCPTCRAACLTQPIINRNLLDLIESVTSSLCEIPEIPLREVQLTQQPIAMGSYADVYLAKWNCQDVAVKRLRIHPESDKMKSLKLETSLAISLLHPNIVRVFGSLKMDDGFTGIVMERADGGALGKQIDKLSFAQKIYVSLGIIDGLAYLHSRKVAHRDLKPDNVLLFGSEPVAKISDFGTSKVIQTIITNTAMVGTPKYTPPELLQPGIQYGHSADVYSLAIILYELFSGKDPFPGCVYPVQILTALIRNQRPSIPDGFPGSLGELVELGWSSTASDRPTLAQFRNALQAMEARQAPRRKLAPQQTRQTQRPAAEQTAEVNRTTLPVPLISMKWRDSCETGNSKQLRKEMVDNIRRSSNMRAMIGDSVSKAMEIVPRHLFMEHSRAPGSTLDDKIKHAYTYNCAMGATSESNESSPEIIGTQLSLVKITPGSHVLLVGGKGGYINSLVAQIAGINGKVVTVSSKKNILDVCQRRVQENSPFASAMVWLVISDVKNPQSILSTFGKNRQFHAIIYCGAIGALPVELCCILENGGSIIAPVQDGRGQQFQMIIEEAREREIRKITEFGVIFEDAK